MKFCKYIVLNLYNFKYKNYMKNKQFLFGNFLTNQNTYYLKQSIAASKCNTNFKKFTY